MDSTTGIKTDGSVEKKRCTLVDPLEAMMACWSTQVLSSVAQWRVASMTILYDFQSCMTQVDVLHAVIEWNMFVAKI